jgi:hypothetical protein
MEACSSLVVLTEDSEGSEDNIGGEIRGRHQGVHLVHRVHHQGLSNTVPKLNNTILKAPVFRIQLRIILALPLPPRTLYKQGGRQ